MLTLILVVGLGLPLFMAFIMALDDLEKQKSRRRRR